jgi:hypothetical protein
MKKIFLVTGMFMLLFRGELVAQDFAPLPEGFRSILLGMEMDTVKEELGNDSYFLYKGDPDVSLLPTPDYSIIESDGFRFISDATFQFYDDLLYIITINLNPEELDYFSMYTALAEKYGPPASLDPEQVIWENEAVRFSLERPLTVKYIDWVTFTELKEEADTEESYRAASRKEFIELF